MRARAEAVDSDVAETRAIAERELAEIRRRREQEELLRDAVDEAKATAEQCREAVDRAWATYKNPSEALANTRIQEARTLRERAHEIIDIAEFQAGSFVPAPRHSR